MQHVPIPWLKRLIYSYVFLDIVVIVLFLLDRQLNLSPSISTTWGIDSLVTTLASIHAFYSLVLMRFIMKRNPWLASLISLVIYGIFIAAIIEISGNVNIWYRLGFSVFAFLSAMTGPFLPIAAITIAWVLFLFTYLSVLEPTQSTLLIDATVDVVATLSAILGWRFFRRFYQFDGSDKAIRHMAAELEKEQFKASLILESITDGVIIINAQGAVQLINKSAADILGWTKEEAGNIDFHSLMTPVPEGNTAAESQAVQNPIEVTLRTGKPSQNTSLFKTRSREAVYFDVLASPIIQNIENNSAEPSPATYGVIVVFRDVSTARAEEKARADFVSTASHEMRTPVAAIEGYLALALNDKLSKIDDRARSYLQKAHQNTQHLGELFQDLLTTTKAEDGRLTNHPRVVEMSEFLEQLSSDFQLVAQKKNLQVTFSVGAQGGSGSKVVKPLYYTMVDPLRIHEVITNLFDNAIKYTEKGGITIGLTGDEQVVQCFVRDTGLGIPPEDVKHLFQKFYRVDNSVTRTVGGTGLGLFICRRIVELYGGRIWVESKVGEGSTFYINLPRLSSQQAAAQQQTLAA